jgi:serine/threonine-protein phosphatase 2A regulatory subunit B'
LILKKQYSINNAIIIPQLYWNPKYFPKEIISNQCLNRFYTGQEIEVLVDLSWPHLQPVYEFFLQLIVNDAADVKTLKVFITLSFV